jgi:hypothetical protein
MPHFVKANKSLIQCRGTSAVRSAKSDGRWQPLEGGKVITFRAAAAHFRGLLRNCKRIAMKLHELWTLDMLKRHKYSAKVHAVPSLND